VLTVQGATTQREKEKKRERERERETTISSFAFDASRSDCLLRRHAPAEQPTTATLGDI